MVNRANTTTGEDWRRRTLRFGLDEFRSCKVTISVQRNYWKTRSQEITSSSVNGSRDAEALGRRRSNYPTKQQVGSAGMHVGLWTRRDPPGSQNNGGRKSQGGNKPRISRTNNNDRFHSHRRGPQQVVQKKRGQAAERNQAIQEEVGKLVEAGIMKEVHYHDWLSNPVMVKKHDDSWRMCVDFKDLNKACPKDGYPLPEIDWKVESLCGFPFKCFLDAYKGYHQIQMAKEDEEKTAFITSQGIFCYTKMPFGLRNVGATYQRLVDKAFHKQIGKNLEVYVDDLVIKSRTEDEIVRDIEETFKTLREINMKLNPKKCTFGVEEGMFLGYKVNNKGLKVCPDKVETVLNLPSPKCLKDMQKLHGKLASLNRFLAKSAEKSLPFFKTLKKCTKKSDFHWTTEVEEAFKQMKQLIAELPMLTTPMEKEELIISLAAAKETVSAVLMTKREAKQIPSTLSVGH
ncbi:reverse transcriptase domain-containing protein [Tanacetum coccineum]